jgi:hypothetical protein
MILKINKINFYCYNNKLIFNLLFFNIKIKLILKIFKYYFFKVKMSLK